MARGRIAAALLAGGLLASSCNSDHTPQPKAGTQAANAVAAIAAEEEQWARDFAAHDLGRLLAHYAPDATLKVPGIPLLTGTWIRRSLETAVNDRALAISFTHDRIEVARSGELAYSRGHYRVTQTDPRTGQPVTEYGTYLTVWQRQADGRWRALEDFNSPDPAPRPPM